LQLQRQYGNKAVQRLIQRNQNGKVQREAQAGDQHRAVGLEGGEVSGEVQSQIRSARGGGRPLDRTVGSQVGGALGADFSGVKVHTDSQSDNLNRSLSAQAFTTGSDIFFSQGAYNPGTHSGKQLLAHELTHVVQQGGGKQNNVQAKLTVGPAGDKYEEEADQVASQVMRMSAHGAPATKAGDNPTDEIQPTRVNGETTSGIAVAGAGAIPDRQPELTQAHRPLVAQRTPTIQRKIRVYEGWANAKKAAKKEKFDGEEKVLTTGSVSQYMTTITSELKTKEGIDLSKEMTTKMKAKLTEWIKKTDRMAPWQAWLKGNKGRAQDKRFGSFHELGLALLGHLQSRKNKKIENSLAKKTKSSAYIKGKLAETQRAIHTAVEAITDDTIKDKFWRGMGGERVNGNKIGEYRHWYKGVKDVKAMLQGGTTDFKKSIAAIHDASTVMFNFRGVGKHDQETAKGKGVIDTWGDKENFQGTIGGERKNISHTYRATSTAVNENDEWIKEARKHHVLLWAGPSHTTSNMMMLMRGLEEKGHVDKTHTEAVAWAIFAFWNKDFYTFKDGYHTFHEVMDIAQGFGVPYKQWEYPDKPPPNNMATPTEGTGTGDTETVENTDLVMDEPVVELGPMYRARSGIAGGSAPSEADVSIASDQTFELLDNTYDPNQDMNAQITNWLRARFNDRQIYVLAYDITKKAELMVD
jgi:hypothetical protein